MISDLNGSLGSRQFLNVANERTCFASCACAVKVPEQSSQVLMPNTPLHLNYLSFGASF